MATTLSGTLSDTDGCLISQRFARCGIRSTPAKISNEIIRCSRS
jgi:hypothetical protein